MGHDDVRVEGKSWPTSGLWQRRSIVDQLDADDKQRSIADLVEHPLLESALNEHAQLDAHRDQRQEYQ